MSEATASIPPSRSRWSGPAWSLLALACALAAVWFYHWTLRSARGDLEIGRDKHDYYNLLVDGFQEGHLFMKAEPDPALLALPPKQRPGSTPYLLDASLYNGHYYLYFGVVPAVLLHWPFSALTGRDLPSSLALLIMAVAALAIGFLWWRDVRRHWWPALGPRLDWLVMLALGFGTGIPAVLRHPLFYEEATVCGWLCAGVMLWALFRAQVAQGRGAGWLVLAGVACGLAVGSRANLVLAGVATLALGAGLAGWRFLREFRRGVWPALLLAAAGALPVGLALAGYNYARFGSILEFGHSHQLGYNPEQMFRLTNLAHNLGLYYLRPPQVNAYFPYLLPPVEGTRPLDYIGRENVHGEWLWLLAALLILPAARAIWRRGGGLLLLPMLAWFAGNLLVTGLLGVRANRYMLDFHPALVCVVLAAMGMMAGEVHRFWRTWRWLMTGLVVAAGLCNVLASFQVHGFFQTTDPAGYARLAAAADRVLWRLAPWIYQEVGAGETRLRWPPAGQGGTKLLLAAGASDFQDRIWLRLDGNGQAVLEAFHGDHASVRGAPFAYQPGTESTFRFSGAFFMPPPWHGWYGQRTWEERLVLKRRLRLWMDQNPVFDRDLPSYNVAPWLQVWDPMQIGPRRSTVAESQGTGAGRTGRVRLRLKLPADRFGSAEPLLQTGNQAGWNVVIVRYTRPGYVQVQYDSRGQGTASSPEFAVDYAQPQVVEVETPATRDPIAWNEHDTQQQPAADALTVDWNGQRVLQVTLPPSLSGVAEAAVGMNEFTSICREAFAGEMKLSLALEPLAAPLAASRSWTVDATKWLVGQKGILACWQRQDGRQAALVWRREPGREAVELGWLDNGTVQWRGVRGDAKSGELRLGVQPDVFSVEWGGEKLLVEKTDFFAEPMIQAEAIEASASRLVDGEAAAMTVAAPPAGARLPGRIRLHLALPAGGIGHSVPLLSTGRPGKGDLLFLRPVAPNTYLIGIDHWGAGAYFSRPLLIPPERKFEIVVELGSLFDDASFPADRARVRLGSETVIDERIALHPVAPADVRYGSNAIGFSTSVERFPGQIFSVQRHVPEPGAMGLTSP